MLIELDVFEMLEGVEELLNIVDELDELEVEFVVDVASVDDAGVDDAGVVDAGVVDAGVVDATDVVLAMRFVSSTKSSPALLFGLEDVVFAMDIVDVVAEVVVLVEFTNMRTGSGVQHPVGWCPMDRNA